MTLKVVNNRYGRRS